MKRLPLLCLSIVFFFPFILQAQEKDTTKPEKYVFTDVVRLIATPVKDQYSSGTCWSFATTSFIESELARITHDTLDLSEMYFVRKCYEQKARNYVRRQGTANFGEGGQAHDVLNVIASDGMMTEAQYSGLANGQTKPVHAEMEAVLKAMVDALVKNPNGKLTPDWANAISAVLDVYLGPLPAGDEKVSAPKFDPADYVELTSYTHHPFYQQFILEIPDNWSYGSYYNVPLDDLIAIMNNALENGYTVDWDGDVSDKGFAHKKGVAIVPDVALESATEAEHSRWDSIPEKERQKQFYTFEKPVPLKKVTQEMRQSAFDNYSTTDDHLMHITGITRDKEGTMYYITKNSWTSSSNSMGGYLNMSEPYVRLNTIAIMVHKNAIPKEIRKKLSL
jgi:bleomycin hydrolase